jgi:hypothetical protein
LAGSLEAVCKAYLSAEEHWQSTIKRRFER